MSELATLQANETYGEAPQGLTTFDIAVIVIAFVAFVVIAWLVERNFARHDAGDHEPDQDQERES